MSSQQNFPNPSEKGWFCIDNYNVTGIERMFFSSQTPYTLIGPHELGAQAILLPGALVEIPEVSNEGLPVETPRYINGDLVDDPGEYSSKGWRHALWEFNQEEGKTKWPESTPEEQRIGPAFFTRPTSLIAINGIAQAVEIIREESPSSEAFLRREQQRLIKALFSQCGGKDRNGNYPSSYPQELKYTQDACLVGAKLFGDEWLENTLKDLNDGSREVHNVMFPSEPFKELSVPTAMDIEKAEVTIKTQSS
jgi:hypothetical protein